MSEHWKRQQQQRQHRNQATAKFLNNDRGVVSLMAAIAVNPTLLFVHLVFDVLLVVFCWLAFQRSARAAERAEKVHTLHVVPQAAPVIPEHLRRRAN